MAMADSRQEPNENQNDRKWSCMMPSIIVHLNHFTSILHGIDVFLRAAAYSGDENSLIAFTHRYHSCNHAANSSLVWSECRSKRY